MSRQITRRTFLGGAGATLAVGRYARAREGLPANLMHRLASSFTSRARSVRFKYRDKIAKGAFSDGPELSAKEKQLVKQLRAARALAGQVDEVVLVGQ